MLVLAMQFSTCGGNERPAGEHTAGVVEKSADALLENGTEGPGGAAGARAGGDVSEETTSTTGSDEDVTEEPVINWELTDEMSVQ